MRGEPVRPHEPKVAVRINLGWLDGAIDEEAKKVKEESKTNTKTKT